MSIHSFYFGDEVNHNTINRHVFIFGLFWPVVEGASYFTRYHSLTKGISEDIKNLLLQPVRGMFDLLIGIFFLCIITPISLLTANRGLGRDFMGMGANYLVRGALRIVLWPLAVFKIPLRLIVTAVHHCFDDLAIDQSTMSARFNIIEENLENKIPLNNDLLFNELFPLLNIKDLVALQQTSKTMYSLIHPEMHRRGKIYYTFGLKPVNRRNIVLEVPPCPRTYISNLDLLHAYYGSQKLSYLLLQGVSDLGTNGITEYPLFENEDDVNCFIEQALQFSLKKQTYPVYKVKYYGREPEFEEIGGTKLKGRKIRFFNADSVDVKLEAGKLPSGEVFKGLTPLNRSERQHLGMVP